MREIVFLLLSSCYLVIFLNFIPHVIFTISAPYKLPATYQSLAWRISSTRPPKGHGRDHPLIDRKHLPR